MAAVIASSVNLSATVDLPQMALVTTIGGVHVAVWPDNATNALLYATSATGAAWTAPAALPGTPSALGLTCAVWVGSQLTLWFGNNTALSLYSAAFESGTGTFTSQTTAGYAPFGSAAYGPVAAAYDGTFWHVACQTINGGSRSVGVFATPGGGTVQAKLDTGWTNVDLTCLQVFRSGTYLHTVFYDTGKAQVILLPVVWSSGAYTFTQGAAETVANGTGMGVTGFLELDGSVSFILNQAGPLYAVKRLATKSYGSPIALAGSTIQGYTPRVAQDPVSGDLQVIYTTTVNRATGEVYVIPRTGGSWGTPSLMAGGDNAGYQYPIAGTTFGSNQADLMYAVGLVPPTQLDWGALQTQAPAGVPTGVAPSGNVSTLAPTLSWQQNLKAGQPPPTAFEVFVFRSSDNATMWDSGEIDSSADSIVYNSQQGAPPSP